LGGSRAGAGLPAVFCSGEQPPVTGTQKAKLIGILGKKPKTMMDLPQSGDAIMQGLSDINRPSRQIIRSLVATGRDSPTSQIATQ